MNKHSALEFAIASLIPASRDRATARQAHSCAQLIEAFQRLFRDRGLPVAIRSANGLPFASPNGLYNLSRLSVCWLRLGISIERIKPGHPQQNGRHETLQTIDNPFGRDCQLRIVRKRRHPVAQLRRMNLQLFGRLRVQDSAIPDQPHSLKLELPGKPSPLP